MLLDILNRALERGDVKSRTAIQAGVVHTIFEVSLEGKSVEINFSDIDTLTCEVNMTGIPVRVPVTRNEYQELYALCVRLNTHRTVQALKALTSPQDGEWKPTFKGVLKKFGKPVVVGIALIVLFLIGVSAQP